MNTGYYLAIFVFHLAGILTAAHVIRRSLTPQGSVAWIFSLLLFPYVSFFLYWTIGHNKNRRFLDLIKESRNAFRNERKEILQEIHPFEEKSEYEFHVPQNFLGQLHTWGNVQGNQVTLCIDGTQTFQEVFAAIKSATERILISFYIIRSDRLGEALKMLLLERVSEGVEVYLLYDGFGSMWLSKKYLQELLKGGVKVSSFRAALSPTSRLSLNYRQHRKIVVIDSKTAFVGGHNIGEEYCKRKGKPDGWRDTHLKLQGPGARIVEGIFIEDWYHATGENIKILAQSNIEAAGSTTVIPFASGPLTPQEGCSLMFFDAVARSKKRFWVTTPYFVPDEGMCRVLEHAALRGVDVRILTPSTSDSYIVWLAGHSYFERMLEAGIRIYSYTEGFLHQKVFLVDDWWSCVGSANLDNRSFRLNFELSILIFDKEFNSKMEKMLLNDFQDSEEITLSEVRGYSLPFEIAINTARLFSPLL